MNRKKRGFRHGTRSIFTKKYYEKGKINIRKHLQTFNIGDNVQFVADSSVQKGMFPPRFYGKKGVVKAKQGRAYKVGIMDHTKLKHFLVSPIHLKRL